MKTKEKTFNNKNVNESKSLFFDLKSFFLETIKIVVISFIIIVGIRHYVMQPFFVNGKSMEPNFHDGDYLIVDEISYKFNDPARGDVVVFRYPGNPKEFFIKRIIGLPGEKVEIKDNKIVIFNNEHPNGLVIDESIYLPPNAVITKDYSKELKNDEYYVLGDNRNFSADSRSWGVLKKHFIVGRAVIRAWPFSDVSVFEKVRY